MLGYADRIAHVDLSAGRTEIEPVDPTLARAFLGGNGFAAKAVHDRVPPDADALDARNAIVFATGPLTATPLPGTSRGHLAGISPQTTWFADSSFGGDFGRALKRAGFDAVVITGKSDAPVTIALKAGEARIRNAKDLWGKGTEEAFRALKTNEGPNTEAAVIGPGGENGVLFANVMCSGRRISAAGRCGLGAVLGAKNVKGVTAAGEEPTPIAEPEALRRLRAERMPILKQNTELLTRLGTPFLVNVINKHGMLGTRNCAAEVFEHADALSGERIKRDYGKRNLACHGCSVACGKLVAVPSGAYAGRTVKMAEYETIYAVGSMLENRDIVSVFNANAMCDEMGLDTISLGVTVAFVADCLAQGLVAEQDLGGALRFGEMADLARIVEQTAHREGIGALLALGSERLARQFGNDAHRLLYSVKGLEIPGHSARGLRPMGLGYATSTRGGSHHDTRPKYPSEPGADPGFDDQPEHCVQTQNFTALGDSLVLCRFVH